MWKILNNLFLSNQYIPHGHCYLWQSPLVGLHIISDLLIAIAYFSIPVILLYFVYQRSDTPFPKVFVLFGAFILLCGTGHLIEIWTLWHPTYWLSGIEKAMTALVSCYTALQLVELLPQFLALRTPEQLEAVNEALQAQITANNLAHQELQRSEQTLQDVVAGTASVTGEDFFPALVQHLASSLAVPYVFVSELVSHQPPTLQTLAFWAQDQTGENFVYELPGTPCGSVVSQASLCYYTGQVQQYFPDAAPLKLLNAECYVGAPLLDSAQQVIGVLCIVGDRPLKNEETAKAIVKVFAARAAAELLRQRAETAVHHAYDELELRVQARTADLMMSNAALATEIQERVAAEAALQQQAEHERLISSITQHLHCSLDLPEILNTTVTEIRQVLQCDRVLIYHLSPDGSGEVVVESVGADWQSLMGIVIHDCFFAETAETYLQLYQQGRVQAVGDIYAAALTPCYVELVAEFQVRANLAVPIVHEETLWGLLVAQQCHESREWQVNEIELLKQLATQTAIAIQKFELYQQAQTEIVQRQHTEIVLHHQVKQEQLMSEIAQRIRQSLNLQEILNTTVAEVRQLLQTNRVVIYQFDPDWSGRVVVEAVEPGWMSILHMAIQDHCFAETYIPLYQQGRVRAIDDIHTACLAPCHVELLVQLQVKANLVVPILQGETVWGLLIAHHCATPRHWQDWETNLLNQLATQLAIALQQSELFEQVQQANTRLEQQVQDRTAQLQQALALESALKRITDKVRDSLDENQILHTAVEELVQLLHVDYCDTALYNLEQGTSTTWYEHEHSLAPDQERTVQMVDFPDVYPQLLQGQYLQFCRDKSSQSAPRTQRRAAILTCPIFDDQGVIGDLWLSHEEDRSFNELEIRLVQQVANQCAIALRQARLYQFAQAQVEELEKLNRLKDDFLSTVSHELRTPMSSIKMATHMLELVLRQAGLFETKPNTVTRYFKILQDECRREIGLINDLLDLARLDAGTEPLILMTTEFQDWLASLAEPFVERALNQQQALQLVVAANLPPLTADLACLEQVLTELLHNACKYTPAGEAIAVEASVVNGNWQLSVSNSGVEIPASECDHIFDKFYRIPNNDPWKHGGTGLGLALVKKRVERLGATIRVESKARQITFTIELPISPMLTQNEQRQLIMSQVYEHTLSG